MSYADDFDDIGGAYANRDYEIEVLEYIEEDRNKRLNRLKGKFVITCYGKKMKLYLQDQRISKNHYWTKYLNNAIGFTTLDEAKQKVSNFKYNNPRIEVVLSNFSTTKI